MNGKRVAFGGGNAAERVFGALTAFGVDPSSIDKASFDAVTIDPPGGKYRIYGNAIAVLGEYLSDAGLTLTCRNGKFYLSETAGGAE